MSGLSVAIVGATGAVGKILIERLSTANFPVHELRAFASSRSLGKSIQFKNQILPIQTLSTDAFKGCDIVFFDASDAVSQEWVPVALAQAKWVIDNSGVFRLNPTVPLVVPEVNGAKWIQDVRAGKYSKKLVAGPNCSTVQLVMALKPLQDRFKIRRVVVTTFQSVSGAGIAALDELNDQSRQVLSHDSPSSVARPVTSLRVFPAPIGFNTIPQIGRFLESGSTSEENKIENETRKLLANENLRISATAVRVPTHYSHCESVNVEFSSLNGLDLSDLVSEVQKLFSASPGIQFSDIKNAPGYPTNLSATGNDLVHIGRVRLDSSVDQGLNIWVVSDNLRKGAASNAVQIAELLWEAKCFG